MLSPRLLVVAVALAGCATPGALDVPADHPAHLGAPGASVVLAADALPPVARPDLPAALRPDGHAAPTRHVMPAHDHSAMAVDPTPLSRALGAYLAVHDALASDRLVPGAAATLAAAFDALAEAPPPGDPHFWHMRAEPVAAVRAAAAALASTGDLDAARAAFGALSVPFARLVEALGVPDGVDLVRHTCGMADVAEGGVWLQRPGAVENPFFGAAMQTCGTPDASEEHESHDAHRGHGMMSDDADASL